MMHRLHDAHKYYPVVLNLLEGKPLASSLLVLGLLLPALVVFRQSKFRKSLDDHTITNETYQLWVSLLLLLSPAFEFPFMFALHPVTLAYYSQPTVVPSTSGIIPNNTLPSPIQLILQVAGYFVVQSLFAHYVLRFVTIPLTAEHPGAEKSEQDDEMLTAMVMDFVRPRGTLLLGVAAMGLPSVLNRVFGRLHPLAMVAWLVIDWIDGVVRGRVCL